MPDRDVDARARTFTLTLGRPVRFLALRWDAGWEFDAPVVLLEPVVRFAPTDIPLDSIIEDTAIDIALARDLATPITDEDTTREFSWRGWRLGTLRRAARHALKGKKSPIKRYVASEQWLLFEQGSGETIFREVSRPERRRS